MTFDFISPCPITDSHHTDSFCSGVATLDNWLRRRARNNETADASRTYVLCDDEVVIGYYALAAGSVAANMVPKKLRRNMPDPIPVIILGRLAVDLNYQGMRLGSALLRDAVLRVLQAADIAGVKAMLVHAISQEAREFYEKRGFIPSPLDPMTLMLPLDTIRKAIREV